MSGSSPNLAEVRGFTRGFLLASDWADETPDSSVAERVPRLGGEDMKMLYRAFRALPAESRRAFRTTWAKRDRLRRIDEAVDLHPSWMVETLKDEPPALFLLALGELEPDLARSVLRELWPKKRPRAEDALGEISPLSPSLAGAFRRWLFERWVHLPSTSSASTGTPARSGTDASSGAPAPGGAQDGMSALLALDAGQLWLLAQEFGRKALADHGGRLTPDHPSKDGRLAFAASADDNERIGLLGLRLIARVLAGFPRDYALHIAQRIALPVARPFLDWRDEFAALRGAPPAAGAPSRSGTSTPDGDSAEEMFGASADEILERAKALSGDGSRGEQR
ncbi:MAG: hypothetical protein R3E97_13875 [Candidatus Eisenbacteria bacterium]